VTDDQFATYAHDALAKLKELLPDGYRLSLIVRLPRDQDTEYVCSNESDLDDLLPVISRASHKEVWWPSEGSEDFNQDFDSYSPEGQ
jgi:hypothetical protein